MPRGAGDVDGDGRVARGPPGAGGAALVRSGQRACSSQVLCGVRVARAARGLDGGRPTGGTAHRRCAWPPGADRTCLLGVGSKGGARSRAGCGPCARTGCGPCARTGCGPCARTGCGPCARTGCGPCARTGCGRGSCACSGRGPSACPRPCACCGSCAGSGCGTCTFPCRRSHTEGAGTDLCYGCRGTATGRSHARCSPDRSARSHLCGNAAACRGTGGGPSGGCARPRHRESSRSLRC